MKYLERSGLRVAECLVAFAEEQLLPGIEIEVEQFWGGYAKLLKALVRKNEL